MIRASNAVAPSMQPDLTPLLDIIFIVMVFLLMSVGVHLQTLEIEVPSTDNSSALDTPPPETLTLSLAAEPPYWAINADSYASWDSFQSALLAQLQVDSSLPVVITADKRAQVEQMMQLLALLQTQQVSATQIVMEQHP